MKVLKIRWQRLVDEKGETCVRCGATESAVREAVGRLARSLGGLGVEVVLEEGALTPSEFANDTLESNRIWVGGKPLEEWLSAFSGQSCCGTACGDSDCRTLTVDGKTYEAIPSELIVKAGLLAAAELVQGSPEGECGCGSAAPAKPAGKCCS